jgi:NAD(P)-dependent dehydrogenase (short-subunit alcohol dehydrogenase family)
MPANRSESGQEVDLQMKTYRILVIDGQGGGLGRAIVERFRKEFTNEVELVVVGTNALAAQAMMKAGADAAASGDSAVIYNCRFADLIVGPIGILTAGSMMGELSPAMALAIAESPAEKVLIPLNRCHLQVVGVIDESMPVRLDQLIVMVRRQMIISETGELR